MAALRMFRLDRSSSVVWLWHPRLDRRNGYLAWGPVGQPFNRRILRHWLYAAVALWREGKR